MALKDAFIIDDQADPKTINLPMPDVGFVLATAFSFATTASFTGVKGMVAAAVVGAAATMTGHAAGATSNFILKSAEVIREKTLPFRLATSIAVATAGAVGGYIVSQDIVENGVAKTAPAPAPAQR